MICKPTRVTFLLAQAAKQPICSGQFTLVWQQYGIHQYPMLKHAPVMRCGRSKFLPAFIFKHRLMNLPKKQVCQYSLSLSPYCSKWNPIEHRLFSQVHKAMEGVVSPIIKPYKTYRATSTKTGLTVVVRLNLNNIKRE